MNVCSEMSSKSSRPQAPKRRNWLASQVVDPNGPFRQKTVNLKNKYKRKPKHKGAGNED